MKDKFEQSAKGSSPSRLGGPVDTAQAERIAVGALDFLAGDPGRLTRFLDSAGLDPGALRDAAAAPGFLPGVLDHVVSDEPLLLACAAALAIPPERLDAAWRRLSPQEFD